MHTEVFSCAALIALIFLQNRQNESFLKLANSLGIEDVALIHLHNECFELISHSLPLSLMENFATTGKLTAYGEQRAVVLAAGIAVPDKT